MVSADIRRLQYLNDLIGQTLEAIQQRSFGYGLPYAMGAVDPRFQQRWDPTLGLGYGAQPQLHPFAQQHLAGPNPFMFGYGYNPVQAYGVPFAQGPAFGQGTPYGVPTNPQFFGQVPNVQPQAPWAASQLDRIGGVNPIAIS